jgi:hypothetical protein
VIFGINSATYSIDQVVGILVPFQCLHVGATVGLVIEHPFPGRSTSTDVLCRRPQPDGRPTPVCAGRHYRVKFPPDSPIGLCLRAQRVVARAYASPYRRSSWLSSSAATPETVPVTPPVEAKKTGLLEASANTGSVVSVKVRLPDASLKRPVPPAI